MYNKTFWGLTDSETCHYGNPICTGLELRAENLYDLNFLLRTKLMLFYIFISFEVVPFQFLKTLIKRRAHSDGVLRMLKKRYMKRKWACWVRSYFNEIPERLLVSYAFGKPFQFLHYMKIIFFYVNHYKGIRYLFRNII